jgi:NTP pyrophosphatase (non-canonical NTP hydrolase)
MDFKEYQDKAKTTAQYPNLPKIVKTIAQKVLDTTCPEHTEMHPLISSALDDMEKHSVFTNPYYPALGLAGEVGEFCNKLKKVMRDKSGVITPEFVEFAEGEIGDILWYVAACCSELGLNMDEVAAKNIQKLFSRKERGVITGNGDNR